MGANAGEVLARISVDLTQVQKGMDQCVQIVTDSSAKMATAMGSAATQMSQQFDTMAASISAAMTNAAGAFATATTQMQASTANLNAAITQLSQQHSNLNNVVANSGSAAQTASSGFNTAALGIYYMYHKCLELAEGMKEVILETEKMEFQINSLLGSQEKGAQGFKWITDFAKKNGLSIHDATMTFKELKNAGIDPTTGAMQHLVDISASSSDGLKGLHKTVREYAVGWEKMELTSRENRVLMRQGIPLYQAVADAMRTNIQVVQKMGEEHKLGRKELEMFHNELGRKVAGTAAKQAEGLNGAINRLGVTVGEVMNNVRDQGGFDFIKDSANRTAVAVSALEPVILGLGKTVGVAMIAMGQVIRDQYTKSVDDAQTTTAEKFGMMQATIIKAGAIMSAGLRSIAFAGLEAAKGFLNFEIVLSEFLHTDAVTEKLTKLKAGLDDVNFKNFAGMIQEGMDQADAAINKVAEDSIKVAATIKAATDTGGTKGKGDKAYQKPKGEATALEALRTQNEQEKAIEAKRLQDKGQYFTQAAEMDLKFWQAHVNDANLTGKERISIQRKIADDEIKIGKEGLDERKAQLESELASYRNNFSAKRSLLLEERAMYPEKTKEYDALTKRINVLDKEETQAAKNLADQRLKTIKEEAILTIEEEEGVWRRRLELNLIDGQTYLTHMKTLAAQKLTLRKEEFEAEIALEKAKGGEADLVKIQALNRQIATLKRQSAKEINQIDLEAAKNSEQAWKGVGQTMSSSIATATKDILLHTKSLSQALKQMWNSILMGFVDMGLKMAESWALTEAKNLLITQGSEQAKSLAVKLGFLTKEQLTAAAAATTAAKTATETTTVVTGNAAQAATGAAAAVAPTPWVGPALAVAAFAATMALCMGAISHSAAGGFDIGSFNPITQLHAKEMVLPAPIADGVRNMVSNGGGKNSGPSHVHHNTVHMNVSTPDADSFLRSEIDVHRQAWQQMKKYNR